MQNTGAVSSHYAGGGSFDIGALPGAPAASASGGSPPKPAAAASASGGSPPKPAAAASASGGSPPKPAAAASASGGSPPKPAAQDTGIDPEIKSDKDILDYLSTPDESVMRNRLKKVGAWLYTRGKHADHGALNERDLFILNKLLISSNPHSASDEDEKHGEDYKRYLTQKLTNKPAKPASTKPSVASTKPSVASTEPSVASTEPSVTPSAGAPIPGVPLAAKRANDPHGLIKKSMKEMKKLLVKLQFTKNPKYVKGGDVLRFTDEEIGKPGSEERKNLIAKWELEREIRDFERNQSQTESSFADKVKFYKEALRRL
jgi:hypothetical protein